MAWAVMLLAQVFDVAFALGLKATHGFMQFLPSIGTMDAGVASVVLMSRALLTLPVSTRYAT